MNNRSAFYKIGSIGIILTTVLHIVLASTLENTSVHTSFALIYPSWIAFLVLGSGMEGKRREEQ